MLEYMYIHYTYTYTYMYNVRYAMEEYKNVLAVYLAEKYIPNEGKPCCRIIFLLLLSYLHSTDAVWRK